MLEKGNHCFLLSMCPSLSGFCFSFFSFLVEVWEEMDGTFLVLGLW